MKTYVPCPHCMEFKTTSPLYFKYAYIQKEKHVEMYCKTCNFVTFAKLPKEEKNEESKDV